VPTRQGLIVGAFVAADWLEATSEHFPDREPVARPVRLRGCRISILKN
jgi:hypothetical protein